MITALIGPIVGIVGEVIRRTIPDREAQAKAEAEALQMVLGRAHELERAATEIVRTEAASQHWLAANWRPITMLTFLALIVARWLGYAAPGISEAEVIKLWSIVELGLGGYVIGRTVEKVLPTVAETVRPRPAASLPLPPAPPPGDWMRRGGGDG